MREFNEFQNANFEKDAMAVEQPKHDAEERPKVEKPKHEVEERPRVERPRHEIEERPRSVEDKINFIINFSTDKKQLLELKKILVELEFYGKEEGKEILENDERKIRRR